MLQAGSQRGFYRGRVSRAAAAELLGFGKHSGMMGKNEASTKRGGRKHVLSFGLKKKSEMHCA